MKFFKFLLVVACLTTCDVAVPGFPAASFHRRSLNNVEFSVKHMLASSVTNATQLMKTLYPFITSSNYLEGPHITLDLDLNTECYILRIQDKFGAVYKQLAVFMEPLHLAFSYETTQGPQHGNLASILQTGSGFLSNAVQNIKTKMLKKKFSVPDYPKIPESYLNELTRSYLSSLVQAQFVNLTMTDDVVKRYRNYVIVYMLHDVIIDITPCITNM